MRLVKGQPCRVTELSNSDDAFLEPHRHEYWELVWCVDNQGSQSIDFIDYDNKVGRVFTVAPGQVHRSELVGENARYWSLPQALSKPIIAIHNWSILFLPCIKVALPT